MYEDALARSVSERRLRYIILDDAERAAGIGRSLLRQERERTFVESEGG